MNSLFGENSSKQYLLYFPLWELIVFSVIDIEIAGKYNCKSSEGFDRISVLEDYIEFQRKNWTVKVALMYVSVGKIFSLHINIFVDFGRL